MPKLKAALVLPTMTQLVERLAAPRPSAAARVGGGLVYALLLVGPLALFRLAGLGPVGDGRGRLRCAELEAALASGELVFPPEAQLLRGDLGNKEAAERVAASIGRREDDACPRTPWSATPPTERQVNARRTRDAVTIAEWDWIDANEAPGEGEAEGDTWEPLDGDARRAVADTVGATGAPWLEEPFLQLYVDSGAHPLPPAALDLLGMALCNASGPSLHAFPVETEVAVSLRGAGADLRRSVARHLCAAGSQDLLID